MHGRDLASLLLVALLASAGAASAQDEEQDEDEDERSRPGIYFLARFSNNVLLDGGDYSTGADGAIGYRIHRWLAAELEGDWISGFEPSGLTRLVGGTYGPNARFFLRGGELQVYALAGLGATFFHARNTSLAPFDDAQWDMSGRFGVGVEWYVSDEVGLNFGPTFVVPFGANDAVGPEFSYVSIGLGAFLRLGE